MLKKIICWGAAGHARVLRESLGADYTWIALFDNDPNVAAPFPDVPLYIGAEKFLEWRAANPGDDMAFVVAIGRSDGRQRLDIQRYLESHRLTPINVIHARAFVAETAILGRGCQILAQAGVCVDARLGDACIVNTGASVDHECMLGHGVHVGPGAVLAGCVHVGDHSLIGAGAVVLPRITIGRNVIVGAGAVVTKDVTHNQVVHGNPARMVRSNDV